MHIESSAPDAPIVAYTRLVLVYSVRMKYAPVVWPVVEKSKMRAKLKPDWPTPGVLYLASTVSVKSPVPRCSVGSDTYGPTLVLLLAGEKVNASWLASYRGTVMPAVVSEFISVALCVELTTLSSH